MKSDIDRMRLLQSWGAPPNVRAVAELLHPAAVDSGFEGSANRLMSSADSSGRSIPGGVPAWSPEIESLLTLDRHLPPPLRMSFRWGEATRAAGTQAADRATTMVSRTMEAITPWLPSTARFRDAARLADDRDWGRATPQMQILAAAPELPRNGALWRGRMTKHTDLTMPFASGLATEETIEITAEGRDDSGGGGYRNYTHFLVSAHEGPDLLKLTEDTGRIEMAGDDNGTMLRIQKRVTVVLSQSDDTRFGGFLTLGLSTLIWLWGLGFLVASAEAGDTAPRLGEGPGEGHVSVAGSAPASRESKQIPRKKNDGAVTVAVLGGGPAGLACAWLLSKPRFENRDAWTPPAGTSLDIKVVLVESACRPGGKAASGRRTDDEQYRIEEHGLHVLMGFYQNVFEVMRWTQALDSLVNVFTMSIPSGDASDPARAYELTLSPWRESESRLPAMAVSVDGFVDPAGSSAEAQALSDAGGPGVEAARASPPIRPFQRAITRLWERVAALGPPPDEAPDPGTVKNLALQVGLQRLALGEIAYAADQSQRVGDGASRLWSARSNDASPLLPSRFITPLANQARALGRLELSASDPDEQVQLTGELVELATTIAIGLDDADLFPAWAIDDPSDLLGDGYAGWVQKLQDKLDSESIADWLDRYGADEGKGFAQRSKVVKAITAGLFTTPDRIAAGTFINGITRLLLTYGDAPFKLMRGGTGEAVIGPIYAALLEQGVQVRLGTEVQRISINRENRATAVTIRKTNDADLRDFKRRGPASRPGWSSPPVGAKVADPQPEALKADAFVLAIPPFQGAIKGLPDALTEALESIESRATIGLQNWTEGPPRYGGALVAGFKGPLSCAAAMAPLQGDEGSRFIAAPVYYCGDVDDAEAALWLDGSKAEQWLSANAGKFQVGAPAHPFYTSVNLDRSQRYGLSTPGTLKQRKYAYETGVKNLWLAGDWTRTTLSCGSIEAAFTSGLEAARDILEHLGCTVDFPIVGAAFARVAQ